MAMGVRPVRGHVQEGDAALEKCPRCGVPGSKFKARRAAGFTGLCNRCFK